MFAFYLLDLTTQFPKQCYNLTLFRLVVDTQMI